MHNVTIAMTEPGVTRADLAKLLAQALGNEKAYDAVSKAAQKLGLRREKLDKNEALSVLELIAQTPGLVGITARFAKSRFHLR
ncbi:MAG TPA: hypothetical protein PKL17_14115 [Pseudomonadota bacterium]|nr:hypothetical protein [Pseudomonadota bacterium]HNK45919.1 hypothetical protein [Pseudomonadota bacterium]HNN52631.1 hypothetical protein [Pseudomonadota bacterium]